VVQSAARAAADELREEILRRPEGDWLGSEDEVLQRLGISRPTLRQAARLLEAEQLLVVKRGLNGGLFTRKPTAEGVAHTASVFLRSAGTSLLDLSRTQLLLMTEITRLAAQRRDVGARAGLLEWVRHQDFDRLRHDRRTFARARVEFSRELARVSGSTTLTLFLDVLWELGSDQSGLFMDDANVEMTIRHWHRVAEAVAEGDDRRAVNLTRKNAAAVLTWLEDHLGNRRLGQPLAAASGAGLRPRGTRREQ